MIIKFIASQIKKWYAEIIKNMQLILKNNERRNKRANKKCQCQKENEKSKILFSKYIDIHAM